MIEKPVMPRPVYLGDHMSATVGFSIHNYRNSTTPNNHNYRSVMGFFLPPWQRGLVWSEKQSIRLIESLWMGLNIGTFTFNRTEEYGGPLDNLLIDGQQRMWAIQQYLDGVFPVRRYRWQDLPRVDQRSFEARHFHYYITKSEDEAYLRGYYDLMNFGGVAHTEADRDLFACPVCTPKFERSKDDE